MVLLDIDCLLSKTPDPHGVLLSIKDLRRYVINGVLREDAKRLLNRISPHRLQRHFRTDGAGEKLLSKICKEGVLSEVRYAFEVLHLDELETFRGSFGEDKKCNLLLTVLAAPKSSAPVIDFILSKGMAVTPKIFSAWAVCSASDDKLRDILNVLVKHNDGGVPPLRPMFPALDHNGPSAHVDLLREVLGVFPKKDLRDAARLGYAYLLERMTEEDTSTNKDYLADLFEMCEVSRYCNTGALPKTLPLFRRSLQLRRNTATRRPFCQGSWTQFSTPEDIDRIERQMDNDDYLECSWQILLAAARAGMLISRLTFHATKGIRTLEQLLEVKNFVLASGHFHGEPTTFLDTVRERCDRILHFTEEPQLTMLPTLYDCIKEVFSCEAASKAIVYTLVCFFNRLTKQPLRREQFEEVRQRKNEVLFLAGFSLSKPSMVQTGERTQKVLTPIIDRLLKMGAILGLVPGQKMSSLHFILQGQTQLIPGLKDILLRHACCRMDLGRKELTLLGLPLKPSSPPSLKCLAAAQSTKFPLEIIQDYLVYELDIEVASHPPINYN